MKSKPSGKRELCDHTKTPVKWEDFMKWWLEQIKTHKQVACPHCGGFKIWEKK